MAESTIILGRYELLEVIGDGAEGRVYKASCVSDSVPGVTRGELVALKRLKSTGQDKESQQFKRQIDILRKLNHPNIVRYKDSFVWREKELEEDIHCLVMELLDGETLKSLLAKNRDGLPWKDASSIFSQVLQALDYAAKSGVIHRDLKPSNIHVTSKGIPKLVDFGIARQDDGEATATSSAAGAKGTFDYMAPDFALMHGGFRGDEQSDIFSFGVLLYHSLAGRLPFPPLGENASRGYYIRWLGQSLPSAEYRHPSFRVLSHARTCIAKCIESDRQARSHKFEEVMGEFAKIGPRQLKHGAETYEFVEWLGKGGFGEVFRAIRASDRREVAVKRLFSSGQSARFVREAKILRNAKHPNLTEYIDFVEVRLGGEDREYYLILEYLKGMPAAGLRDRIKDSESGMDPTETLRIFLSYLSCLEHLHRNGIIHRDIKPGNLYAPANEPQRAKIFDLGIAHDEEGTRTHGQVPGTLDYMPPEFGMQSSGRGSAQSDIFSIGITLYFALTKKLPFPRLPEKEADAWVAFIRRSEKPLECTFDHPVFGKHPELVPLLRRALSGDPKKRQESAKALADEIQGILQGWDRKKACDAAVAAGRAALESQNFNEAERQAGRALELMPKDQAARQLLTDAREGRKQLYTTAMAAAKAALGRGNFDEAEKQAGRALELVPSDKEARQALAKAQAGKQPKAAEEPADDFEERPTAVTMATIEVEPAEEATAATRPADVEKILEFEKAARKEEQKAARVEKVEVLTEEQQRQAAEASKRRSKAAFRWVAIAAAVVVFAGGLYFGWKWYEASQEARYAEAMAVGQTAFEGKHYTEAIKEADVALDYKPRDPAALKLRSEARTQQRNAAYQEAMKAGLAAYEGKQYKEALSQAKVALDNKPADPDAAKLRNDAQTRLDELNGLQQDYAAAMKAGRAAYEGKQYAEALRQAMLALDKVPGDSDATNLRNDAQARLNELKGHQQNFEVAMKAGKAAFALADYAEALKQALVALDNLPNHPDAVKLRDESQNYLTDIKIHKTNYDTEIKAGWMAIAQKKYGEAIKQADLALANVPNDEEATRLKKEAQGKLERQQNYEAAMKAGLAAYEGKQYMEALRQAGLALENEPGDQNATRLRNDAQARLKELKGHQQNYEVAMKAGKAAFALADYAEALKQALVALDNLPNDSDALNLRNDAQNKLDDIARLQQNYEAAMKAGLAALAHADFQEALKQAGLALNSKPDDPTATQLKNDAQAQLDKYTAAIAQGRDAFSTGRYFNASRQADLALAIKPGDSAATKLRNDAETAIHARPPRDPKNGMFGVSGFDFIWVPDVNDGEGAYVEKTELSQAQYAALSGKYGLTASKMPISGTGPDDPANLSYDDAKQLCDALGKAGPSANFQGQFKLPNRRDFLVLSELGDSTGTSNPTFAALAGTFSRLGANVGEKHPRGVGEGSANRFGLFNALGNAWAWCDDQSGAGFEYDSTFGSLFRAHRDVQGLYTGARFIFVPAR